MKRLLLILLICITLMPVLPASTAQPPGSDAPYLYYYSERLNAFVIERADGTDSRIFGDVALHQSTNSVFGAGWSPSGKWFAFITKQRQPFGFYETLQTVLLDARGQVHELPDLEGEIDSIQWELSEDILLAVMLESVEGTPAEIKYYYLLDVANGTIKADLITLPDFEAPFQSFHWQQGNWMAAGYKDIFEPEHIYKVVDLTKGSSKVVNFPQSIGASLSPIGANGWIIENRDGNYFAFNLFSEATFAIPTERVYGSTFSPTSQYALIREQREESPLWLVDFDTQTVEKLPENVFLQSEVYPVWSPDEQFLVLQDADNIVHLYEIETRTLSSLDLSVEPYPIIAENGWYFDHMGRLIAFYEVDSLAMEGELHIFENGQQSLVREIPLISSTTPVLSHDEQYIGIVIDGAVVQKLKSRERYDFLPHSGGYFTAPGGSLRWHDSSHWFFGFDDALSAGGAQSIRWVSVGNADSKYHRDLTFCAVVTVTCVNWLPDKVNVDDLPIGKDTSVTALPQPELKISVGDWSLPFWSENGDFIRTYNTVFNASTGHQIENVDNIAFTEEPTHQLETTYRDENYHVERVIEDNQFQGFWLFDSISGEKIIRLPDGFWAVDFSPDDRLLAVSTTGFELTQVWDLEERELITTLPNSNYVAFSPDGTKLAAGVSWEVWIWDVEDLVGE